MFETLDCTEESLWTFSHGFQLPTKITEIIGVSYLVSYGLVLLVTQITELGIIVTKRHKTWSHSHQQTLTQHQKKSSYDTLN